VEGLVFMDSAPLKVTNGKGKGKKTGWVAIARLKAVHSVMSSGYDCMRVI